VIAASDRRYIVFRYYRLTICANRLIEYRYRPYRWPTTDPETRKMRQILSLVVVALAAVAIVFAVRACTAAPAETPAATAE